MLRSVFLLAVTVTLGAASCGRGPSHTGALTEAIVGGSEDAGYGRSDVFMTFMSFSNGNTGVCTATLIAPRTLVTSAHCVDPARVGAASVTIQAINKPTDQGLLSSDIFNVTEYRLHPSWTSGSTSATYDIALLLLQNPRPETPRPFNRTALTNFTGQTITIIGYGRTAAGTTNSGVRRQATATVNSFDSTSFDFGVAGSLGICSGDSGGPALYVFSDSVERLVGVHAGGSSTNCGVGTDTRIDIHTGFIDTWIAQKENADAGGTGGGSGGSGGTGGTGGSGGTGGTGGSGGSGGTGGGPATGTLGDPCVQSVTNCTGFTVCAAPPGTSTTCRPACETDGGCPQLSHCESGVGGQLYCRANQSGSGGGAGNGADGGTDPGLTGSCGCAQSGPLSAWAALLLLLTSSVGRRARRTTPSPCPSRCPSSRSTRRTSRGP